jgi:hypothetical protein
MKPGLLHAKQTNIAYSAAMDFVLAFLPWKVILGVQLRRREMIGVTVCMSLGVL